MIAVFKSFLNPKTQQQMYQRVVSILIACIAVIFMMLLMYVWSDAHKTNGLTNYDKVQLLRLLDDINR